MVDTNRSPYFDDYTEDKKFYKLLHVPRRPVQTRELNQVQSIFNKQIERFADHVFDNGSMVIPGEVNFDLDYSYIKVTVANVNNIASLLVKGAQLISTSGVTAELDRYVSAEDSDPATFYIKYLNANDTELKFAASEIIQVRDQSNNLITTATVIEEGIGSKLTVNEGVYYVEGKFCLVDRQTVILSKYDNTPSATAGFLYKETIVTERDDASLNDNAQGTENFTAPGAHRLKIDLELVVYPLAELSNAPSNYIEIFRIKDGLLQRKARGPEYNILDDVLAQRTSEESGDYTVKSFRLALREHLLENNNRGVFTAAEGGDADKYVAQVEAGVAYVRGYRVENLSTINIEANKARTTDVINNSSLSAALGYYIVIEDLSRLPNTKDMLQISFYDGAIDVAGGVPNGTVIGTARVRFLQKVGSSYRLYLFDIRDASGVKTTSFLTNAVCVYHTNFTANLVEKQIFDASNNSLVYSLNVPFVKSLLDETDQADTSFTTVRQFTGTTDTSGNIIFSTTGNEVFTSQNENFSIVSYLDANLDFDDVVGNFTLGGSPVGSTITLSLGLANASRPILVNLQTAKETVTQKTKTSTNDSVTGSLSSGVLSLEKADVYKINSILDDSGNDVTSLFTLNSNKTRSFYDLSFVQTSDTVAEPITVNFTYFAHSSGDFFSVDSYVDVDYEDIPVEDGVRLSDVIDFRPRISNDGTNFTALGAVVGNIPTPFSIIRADAEHYLARIDKVYVDFKGNFAIAEGTAALAPKEPSDVSGAMTLYTLYVPPYTFTASDINAVKRNNKRYTMRDIGNLENRISNVEYYVSLNYLEQEALSKQIIDPTTGLNRFKNGIIVDPFVDLRYSDTAWSGFSASVSPFNGGSLRPSFRLNAVDLIYNATDSTDVVVNDGIAMLPFTETVFIDQNLSTNSINVNPYAVFRWAGDIKVSPSTDIWFDTVFTEPEVVFQTVQVGSVRTNLFGGWQTNWSGVENSIQIDSSGNFSSSGSSAQTLLNEFGTSSDIVTGSIITTNTTVTTNSDFVGDRIVGTSVIPFMRSRHVEVTGVGNRPNAKMNFFFDNVNVNDYITPESGSVGDDVITDAVGNFTATFTIPNNNTIRFRTGERLLTVTDNENNNRVLSTSHGQATYTAQGTVQTVQQTIVSTRVENVNVDINWVDPVAQSFLVESDGGAFITKIELFFASKDQNLPVAVDIREMENGFPTQRIVPGSKVTLIPSQVNVSEDSSVATVFELKAPVYLNDNTEYCFVVSSNSDDYNIYIATMGEVDLLSDRAVAKQPYAGVMFKSQNASTWTADQMSDLKFVIHKAQFETNTNATLVMNNDEPNDWYFLDNDPLASTNSSSLISFTMNEDHDYFIGSYVLIQGAVGDNGYTDAQINIPARVAQINNNRTQIVLQLSSSQNATASGSFGGSNVKISRVTQASLLMPNVFDIKLPKTNLTYQIRGYTGRSFSGEETAYQQISNWTTLENKENFELNRPWLIAPSAAEDVYLSSNKTLSMRAIMSTTNANVSPVVDLNAANVVAPYFKVNFDDTPELDGSNNFANNRTLAVTLKQPAESLRVFLDISRVQESDVIVSARFGNSIEELEAAAWTEIDPVNALATSNRNTFVEQEFNAENLDSYTVFQIMIQLKSSSNALVPVVRKLRAIALGT